MTRDSIGFVMMMVLAGCGVEGDVSADQLGDRNSNLQAKDVGIDLPEPDLFDDLQDNILLIVADDIGVDAVSTYAFGTDPAQTPTLDRLAAAGVTFAQGWANPTCSPTRASILTGMPMADHGVMVPVSGGSGLDHTIPTVADSLRAGGYATALLGKWHLGEENGLGVPWFGKALAHGFDHHAGPLGGSPDPSFFDYTKYTAGQAHPVTPRQVYATFDTTDDAVAWVGEQGLAPWFASVNYNAPHAIKNAAGAWVWEPVSAGCVGGDDAAQLLCTEIDPVSGLEVDVECADDVEFRQSAECMDSEVDRLLFELDELGVLENTTVVFVGDNGTEAPVTNDYGIDNDPTDGIISDSERQLRDKGTVYQGGVHVPFIVADGYHLAHDGEVDERDAFVLSNPGRVEYGPVQVQDLFATFEDIAGVSTPSAPTATSLSFAGLLDGTGTAQRTHAWVEAGTSGHCQRAAMGARYKLVDNHGTLELYDIMGQHTASPVDDDEAEQHNLLASAPTPLHANIAAALEAQLPSLPCTP